jgi:hypothetical protein
MPALFFVITPFPMFSSLARRNVYYYYYYYQVRAPCYLASIYHCMSLRERRGQVQCSAVCDTVSMILKYMF